MSAVVWTAHGPMSGRRCSEHPDRPSTHAVRSAGGAGRECCDVCARVEQAAAECGEARAVLRQKLERLDRALAEKEGLGQA